MNQIYSLQELKGIGEKTGKLFQKLGILSVGDLLRYFPRSYDVYEEPVPFDQLSPGKVMTVTGTIIKGGGVQNSGRRSIVTATIAGESGQLSLMWFNMPFLRNTLKRGSRFYFRGKVSSKGNKYILEQPKIYTPAQYDALVNTLQPVYGLTAGLTNQAVIRAMHQALEYKQLTREYLPEEIRVHNQLADYNYALEAIHFPGNVREYQIARKRLAFDEFFFFILAVQRLKGFNQETINCYPMKRVWETEEVMESLPYSLTHAQLRTWQEIENDLQGQKRMSRLIQGDVGSGKTIVAFLSMIMTAKNGYQSVLMAPTEVLARQHYEDFSRLKEEQNLDFCQPVLLTGSVKGKQRKECYEQIRSGKANIVIGTHALIQETVQYLDLALVITDEQHRFGVNQRGALAKREKPPHVMVMSATPIPRTLGIILYGDLDISVIDQLPAKRLPIKNCVVTTDYRNTAYHFIEKEIQKGHQAYVICPMVEESEGMEGENVIDYTEKLRGFYRDQWKIAYLHGKLSSSEKNQIMERFAKGEIQILVSTTVVEVGVNVPNATVMMIENAERFGLAQLHQLRGRVGRGKAQSYCIFVQGTKEEEVKKRLEILVKSNDGFYIANEDLKLRGPGDFFGVRQSGLMAFKIGDIYQDSETLKLASRTATQICQLDPDLELEQHRILRQRLEQFGEMDMENLNI